MISMPTWITKVRGESTLEEMLKDETIWPQPNQSVADKGYNYKSRTKSYMGGYNLAVVCIKSPYKIRYGMEKIEEMNFEVEPPVLTGRIIYRDTLLVPFSSGYWSWIHGRLVRKSYNSYVEYKDGYDDAFDDFIHHRLVIKAEYKDNPPTEIKTLATKEQLVEQMGFLTEAQKRTREKLIKDMGSKLDIEWHDGYYNVYHMRFGNICFMIRMDGTFAKPENTVEQNPADYSEAWAIHDELSEAGDDAFGTQFQKIRFINKLKRAVATLPQSEKLDKIKYFIDKAESYTERDDWLAGNKLTSALTTLHELLIDLTGDKYENNPEW